MKLLRLIVKYIEYGVKRYKIKKVLTIFFFNDDLGVYNLRKNFRFL